MYWASLIKAMIIRLWSSALFLMILYLGPHFSGAQEAANFIALNAIFYISAAAGKLGADGLATYNAVNFRIARSVKARSLYYSTLILSISTVPFAALLILNVLKIFSRDLRHLSDAWLIIVGSCAFAICQFQGAILQAQKRTVCSSLIFLVIPYAFVVLSLLSPRPLNPIWMVSGLAISCLIGHCWIRLHFDGNRILISARWIREGLGYYTIGLSFFVAEWGVQLISTSLLPFSDAVIFGLSARLSSLLAVPVNSLTGYLQPILGVHMRRHERAAIWKIYMNVVGLTVLSQIAAISLGFIVVMWFLPIASGRFGYFVSDTGWKLLLALVIGQIFNGMTGPSGIVLVMMQNSRLFVVATVSFTILTIAAGAAATLDHGVVALAWTITSVIICRKIVECTILYLYLKRRLY